MLGEGDHYLDTITHTLFGIGLYYAAKKEELTKRERFGLFFTTLVGSQIPDIDVISKLWDYEGMYQMWHRGITHSIFLVPLWALLIYFLVILLFKVKDKRYFFWGMLAVFIHNTSDVLNAWGTGYLEPFSNVRLTLGTVPIIDFVIWAIFLVSFLLKKFSSISPTKIFRYAWIVILIHLMIQTAQGLAITNQAKANYDQIALSASFVPWQYQIYGKNNDQVDIGSATLWSGVDIHTTLFSDESANLSPLIQQKPEAKTLMQWSPFVVIVNDNERLGVFDPRFYRDGESFLFVFIEK